MRPRGRRRSNMPILLTTTNNLVLIDDPLFVCLPMLTYPPFFAAASCSATRAPSRMLRME